MILDLEYVACIFPPFNGMFLYKTQRIKVKCNTSYLVYSFAKTSNLQYVFWR